MIVPKIGNHTYPSRIVNVVMFSIFGRSGNVGMKKIIFNKLNALESIGNGPLRALALACLVCLSMINAQSSYAQCKKTTSTCNLTSITNAFTPTATFLGCATDTCALYYLLPSNISADSAENWANNLGGHLTSIHSSAENDSIVKWVANAGVTGSVWIGFNDKANEGNFVWTDGSDSTYSNWKAGRPNGVGASDDCVQLFVTGADSGRWNDTACTMNLPAVIKVSLCMENAIASDTVCLGDTGQLVAQTTFGSTPYSYIWTNGATSDTMNLSPLGTTAQSVTITDAYGCTLQDTGIIGVDTLPLIDLGGPDTICNDSVIILDAGPGYTYLWNENHPTQDTQTTQVDTFAFAGDYWVHITDLNGCSNTDTFTLATTANPFFSIGGDTAVCDGDTVTVAPFNASGTYTYVWHDNSTGATYQTDTTEAISLTATDSNGCKLTQNKLVTLAQLPIINLAKDTAVCDSTIFSINGPFGFNYHEWRVNTDTTFGPTVTVNQPGNYYYYGRDTNECPAYDTVAISWNPKPVIDLGNDTSICLFDTITLSVANHYVVKLWSTGDTTNSIKVSGANTYSITVSDSNGCQGSDFIVVTNDSLPVVTAMRNGFPGDTTICTNDSVYLHNIITDTNVSYQWNSNPFVKGMDSVVVDTAGKYILTARDTNTCINRDSLVVSLDTLPVVNLTADTTFCTGDSIMLTSNPDTNYNHVWDGVNLGMQDTMWILNDTTYELTLVDKNTTCRSTDSVVITHDTLPIINLGVDTGFCEGDTITLDAGANYLSYSWTTPSSSNDTTQTIKVSTPGGYSVDVVDSNLCKGNDTKVIAKYLLPIPNLGPDKQFCAGTPVNEVLDPGAGYNYYKWSSGKQGDSTLARYDTATVQGLHWVEVTDSNQCSSSDSIFINASFLPTVDLGPDTMFCDGDKFNVLVNAGPGFVKYEWFEAKSGVEVLLPTTGQILLVKDTASVIVVRITDGNGCQNKDTTRIIVNNLPIVNFTLSKYCEAAKRFYTEDVDAGPGYAAYAWSTGETTQRITVTSAGEYTVSVTDATTGCVGGGTKMVEEIPQPNIDWTADSVLCEGTTITLNAQKPGYIHYWWTEQHDDGSIDTLNPFLPLVPPDTIPDLDTTVSSMVIDHEGTFKVYTEHFEEPPGCNDSAFAVIREDIFPVIQFGVSAPDTTLCVGETLLLSPNFSGSSTKNVKYEWQDGNTDTMYLATETGLYSLALTNDCGADIDEVYVTFDDCSQIFIPNAFTPNGDGDNDYWAIVSLQKYISFDLQVFDRNGHVIWETNDPGIFWDGTHIKSGEPIPNGTYIYRFAYRSEFEYVEGVNSAPTREERGQVHIVR